MYSMPPLPQSLMARSIVLYQTPELEDRDGKQNEASLMQVEWSVTYYTILTHTSAKITLSLSTAPWKKVEGWWRSSPSPKQQRIEQEQTASNCARGGLD